MLQLITDPDAFFESRATDPQLVSGLGILLLVGLIGAAGTIPSIQATTAAVPEEAETFRILSYATGILTAVVVPFVRWVVYAGLFLLVSGLLYDADGSLRQLLALTAWGFVPEVVSTAISSAAAAVVFSSADYSNDPDAIGETVRQLQNSPELMASSLAGIPLLLWAGVLWLFAVKHGRGLTTRQAAIVIGIPVGVDLLWRLQSLLT